MPEGSQQSGKATVAEETVHVILLGASAGGLHSIIEVVRRLDPDLPLCVLIVQHLHPQHLSLMAELLASHTRMKVVQASDGEHIHRGFVYTGTPGKHLMVHLGSLEISTAEPLRHQRPSIDMSFSSAANAYKQNCTAVILSGMLTDGAKGISAVKQAGGITIVEDPETAEFDGMPRAALATGSVDYVLKLTEIGPMLNKICAG